MKFALAFVALMIAAPAFANDGGSAAIKVSEIKMRETDGQFGKDIRKLAKPNFVITFKGGEAKKLQQILPSVSSVETAMNPKIAKQFNETFKSLGIYSTGDAKASSKVINISCNDGELITDLNDETKSSIKKHAESECQITINASPDGIFNDESFGDMMTFAPKCSN